MVTALEYSIVRIYKQQNEIVGAGFLVSPEYIVTCAHVVTLALGIEFKSLDKPTQTIKCDFPIIAPEKFLDATVHIWIPVEPQSSQPQDIAILKLSAPQSLPSQAKAIPLITSRIGELCDHPFKAYGFSKDGGVWADGEIKSSVAYNKIQLQGKTVTGYPLTGGFSGTAIWDNQLEGVVGIAVTADKVMTSAKAAFFMPTNVLLEAWGCLLEVATVKGRIPQVILLVKCIFEKFQNELNLAYQNLITEVSFNLVDLPSEIPSSFSDFIEIIYQLDERYYDFSSLKASWLEILISYLILQFKTTEALANLLADNLKQWLQQYQPQWEALINVLEVKKNRLLENLVARKEKQEPCLLVSITKENNCFRLRAWIIKDINHYNPTQKSPQQRNFCQSLTANNEGIEIGATINQELFVQDLKKFYQQATNICECLIQKIQFFFPYQLIEKEIGPIDLLTIDEKPSFAPPPIGTKYEIAIAFSEYIKLEQLENPESLLWKKKCSLFKEMKSTKISEIDSICTFSDSNDPFTL